MKTKGILFLFLIICFSCSDEVQIGDNRRLDISGTVNAPENGDIPVIVYGTRYEIDTENPQKILGLSRTDENGNFRFTSLDTYSHDLLITINPENMEGYNDEIGTAYYLDESGNHLLSYQIGNIELPGRVKLDFTIENTSETQDTLFYTLKYDKPIKLFRREGNGFTEVESDNQTVIYRKLPLSEPTVHHLLISADTDLSFIYNIGDQPVQNLNIAVTPETTSYEFQY